MRRCRGTRLRAIGVLIILPYARLLVSPRDALRPTLRAADDRGREVEVSYTSYSDGPEGRLCDFQLTIPRGAKRLNLSFAVYKSRVAEFLARPSPPARKPAEKQHS